MTNSFCELWNHNWTQSLEHGPNFPAEGVLGPTANERFMSCCWCEPQQEQGKDQDMGGEKKILGQVLLQHREDDYVGLYCCTFVNLMKD